MLSLYAHVHHLHGSRNPPQALSIPECLFTKACIFSIRVVLCPPQPWLGQPWPVLPSHGGNPMKYSFSVPRQKTNHAQLHTEADPVQLTSQCECEVQCHYLEFCK